MTAPLLCAQLTSDQVAELKALYMPLAVEMVRSLTHTPVQTPRTQRVNKLMLRDYKEFRRNESWIQLFGAREL